MALRSLDNTLPSAMERPKKVAKVAVPTEAPRGLAVVNNENEAPPLKVGDQVVEYVASEDLKPLSDPETKIKILLEELNSKNWVEVCESLNDVRRLALYESSQLLPILDKVIVVMVKAMKNPRSALCKTSIMTSVDIFRSFGYLLLSTPDEFVFDPLLLQLLLKASQDKRFVCEEAEKALEAMATSMPPLPLLKKLRSYVNHTNFRVRAKAVVAIAKCVSEMGIDIMKEFGLAAMLQIAAELLNDRLPEAREAARSMINSIYGAFTRDNNDDESEEKREGASSDAESWEDFCSCNLPPISAQSIAKIISQ